MGGDREDAAREAIRLGI